MSEAIIAERLSARLMILGSRDGYIINYNIGCKHRASEVLLYIGGRGLVSQIIEPVTFARCAFIILLHCGISHWTDILIQSIGRAKHTVLMVTGSDPMATYHFAIVFIGIK